MTLLSSKANKYARTALLLIIIALILRVWSCHYGLPYLYPGDELYVVEVAVQYGTGNLVPWDFRYPPFYSYVLFVLYGIYFAIGYLVGVFQSVEEFAVLFLQDPSSFYLIGRLTTALFGTLSVFLLFFLGARVFHQAVGLLGAAFLTFAFIHVKYSQMALTDVPMTFFAILTMIYIFRIYERGDRQSYILSGFLIGVTAMTKYYGILWIFPTVLSHLLRVSNGRKLSIKGSEYKKMLLIVLFVFIGCFVASPFAFLKFSSFWQDFSFAAFKSDRYRASEGWFSNLMGYGKILLSTQVLGFWLGGTALLSVLWVSSQHSKKGVLLISAPLFYVAVMSFSQPHSNYLIPAIPFLCLSLGIAIYDLSHLGLFAHRIDPALMMSAVAIILVVPSAVNIVKHDYTFSQKDTRTIAKEWIEEHIPDTSRIALDWYTPQLHQNTESLLRHWRENDINKAAHEDLKLLKTAYRQYKLQAVELTQGKKYDLYFISHKYWKGSESTPDLEETGRAGGTETTPLSLSFFRERGVDYIITSNLIYERYLSEEGKRNFPKAHQFYMILDRECSLVKVIQPDSPYRPGPTIKVYKARK